MTLPKPECAIGYTDAQVREIMRDRYTEFNEWMVGQTGGICEGRQYNYETKAYVEACGGISHGLTTYSWDVKRFLAGQPVID